MSAPSNREMFAGLAEELAIVVGAMIDGKASAAPGAPAMGRQWVAEVRAEGALTGTLTVVFDHDGAAAVTSLLLGLDGDVPAAELLDTLREIAAQAVSALALKPIARGAKLSVGEMVGSDSRLPEGDWAAYAIASDKLPTALAVTAWGSLSAAPAVAAKPAPAAKPEVAAAPVAAAAQSSAPAKSDSGSEMVPQDRINVILDIDLPLVVRFGRAELPLRALTRLGPGSVIDLGRSPDELVELLVSNRVVARGEVVVVSGNYGVRILDVVSQRERVRSLEV